MIVVDTSALMAIIQNEPEARRCMDVLETEQTVLISAATLAEALIVAGRRGYGSPVATLLDEFGFTVVPVTEALARRVGEAYAKWGKGVHPAKLNFADCFAYVTARDHGCPLLYIGDDFAKTDVRRAL